MPSCISLLQSISFPWPLETPWSVNPEFKEFLSENALQNRKCKRPYCFNFRNGLTGIFEVETDQPFGPGTNVINLLRP
jgi:hypothetical protein